MGKRSNKKQKKNKNTGTVNGIVTPDMLPPLGAPGGKVKQNCHVLGLGRYNVSDGKATFDINKSAVEKSFEKVQSDIKNNLTFALNSFYNSDKNVYYKDGKIYTLKNSNYKLKFHILVDVVALNKTEFTYVYKFDLDFHDEVIQIHINDKIGNLSSSLKRFRTDLVDAFNKYIKSSSQVSNMRTENELDLSSVESIITQCDFAELQKNAPVASALDGKFQLSQVDERLVRTNNLGNRCINVGDEEPENPQSKSGKFNEAVFNMHCDGMSDYDIASDFGVMNLLALSDHINGRKMKNGWSYTRDLILSFFPGVCWANDIRTIGPGSWAKTQGVCEAVATMRKGKASDTSKSVDKWSSKLLAAADLGVTAALGAAAFASGGFLALLAEVVFPNPVGIANAVFQIKATSSQSKSIFENKISLPQAMLNVLDDYHEKNKVGYNKLNVPSHDQLMEICDDWQIYKGEKKGKKIYEKIDVGVSKTDYSIRTASFNGRSGVYEGPRDDKKKKGR